MSKEIETGTQNPASNERTQDNTPSTPVSVRDSITAAIKEVETKESTPAEKPDTEQQDRLAALKKEKPDTSSKEDDNSDEDTDDIETETEEKEETQEKQETEKKEEYKAPVGWTKEAKQKWDALDPDIKKSVHKREVEVSKGFAEQGAKLKAFEEIGRVISKREGAIKQFGASPAETVERLFGWMEALATPNKSNALKALEKLAQNFRIDLPQRAQTSVPQETKTGDDVQNQSQVQMTPELAQILEHMLERQNNYEQQTATQRRQAADASINSWAKDKPHFEKVRSIMHGLLSSGVIPAKNGELDLDAAYVKAIRMDDDLYEQYKQEEIEARNKKAEAKKSAEAAKNKQTVEKARIAGSGLKSQPTKSTANSTTKPNKAQNESVRDSIARTIKELSN